MGSCHDGVDSLAMNDNSASDSGCSTLDSFDFATPLPSPSLQSIKEGTASESNVTAGNYEIKSVCRSVSPGFNQKHSRRTIYGSKRTGKASNSVAQPPKSQTGSSNLDDVVDRTEKDPSLKQANLGESESCINPLPVDSVDGVLNGFLALERFVFRSNKGGVGVVKNQSKVQSANGLCPSPQSTLYTATVYAEAKQSLSITELGECPSDIEKSSNGSGKVSNSLDLEETRKTSTCRSSTESNIIDYSSSSSMGNAMYKPHKANDTRWEAIKNVRSRFGVLGPNHFSLLTRLGRGDIGTVYLAELCGTGNFFAMKVMEKEVLTQRKKLLRAQTEREILKSLDHPFLPTLYADFETNKFSCLVMEYCPGGDLHSLRQKQPDKHFHEDAARFYAAEVLLALEYLHMLGIIYRDLKPENVLVRSDGHIMLSDFDLSLRCVVSPTLVKSSRTKSGSKNSGYCVKPAGLVQSVCLQPTCFSPGFLSGKPKKDKKPRSKNEIHQVIHLPELLAEPTNARSNSFVGTHEYLAPEIIRGEGHGSAVDWWTFGIFLYELLFGRTPFKGQGSRATLFNVIGQPLKFPESPNMSFTAKDLIRGLLAKEPHHRIAYRRGATEVKQHPFFQSINWALIRCTKPPDVPIPAAMNIPSRSNAFNPVKNAQPAPDLQPSGNYLEVEFF